MSKGLSLWFALSSILLLAAASIALTYRVWIALLLGLLCILNIGLGFIVKARTRQE
ncbi:hypothetical protein KIH86_01285 [Paenibacillus sp. HN-1]|uniref:hypothetical protein n=1 Tax=Paenibacillus TaxID=44249 RepID=UPI001CA8723D|nr:MULTISPECIES: hypothetical protein [Paenibacillus]MBY9078880.1 hypothetical protein [Paenibacillus sp. CGMCC 1.18879]MBY9082866.1 hypothetical protein [Paenibacillus sinensis]